MTWFNAVQLALAIAAGVLIARSLKRLGFEAPLDGHAFSEALEVALTAGQLELARRVAAACEPAWPARLASVGLSELESRGLEASAAALEDSRAELAQEAWAGLRTIATLGRMASPLAFIGVIFEFGRGLGGGVGIEGLQRGYAMSAALSRSLLTFGLGASTLLLCLAAIGILKRRARGLTDDLQRVVRTIARAHPSLRTEM